ncbi:hypothetical protein [Flavobacterium sp.]|uniref:toxin-antitoxin system YwqK family antitoxin n=1 Tax=Flavobacterium sp. TaxID=239 RepID=UPI0026236AC3|nr:hypothetical protein [Flavobacterium sp.]
MKFKKTFILIFFLIITFTYSQEKYVEKYSNGNLKVEGFLVGKTLDSIYKEYYENGKIKTEGFYKNCEYKTNYISIYTSLQTCGRINNNDSINNGKYHGTWKNYYDNEILKSVFNYHCGFLQGNNYTYYENGNIESIEFYNGGNLLTSIEYYENGFVAKNSFYTYIHNKKESRNLKTTRELEYYENGNLKIQREIIEKEKDVEIETVKEYYQNGFLKSETELIDLDKNGIYREYYENGNVKYQGKFQNDKPIEKQYHYHENGKRHKIEYWKKGKLINTEIK